MIRICLVEDQALVRSGIRALLGLFEGLEVVAEADNGESGIRAVLDCKPDVLLVDVRMPKLNGVQVITALSERGALPPTLLLTTFEDDAALVAGVRSGARGYLLKGVTPEVLVTAIRTVAAGGSYLYAPLATAASGESRRPAWHQDAYPAPETLTPREMEVLKLMTSGISNGEIAEALRLEEGTVRNYVSSIFSKLGVTDRTKAVLLALHKKLI
ncbi:MAG: response regulator [Steroidobacteraceae bacterium]